MKTHLRHSIDAPHAEFAGDEAFNAKAVRQYGEIILICALELEFLTGPTKFKKFH